jgi:hypothetical protein
MGLSSQAVTFDLSDIDVVFVVFAAASSGVTFTFRRRVVSTAEAFFLVSSGHFQTRNPLLSLD